MPDCVLDATIVHFANGRLEGRRPGNKLDQRLKLIEQIVGGLRRVRYNNKLLQEYQQLVSQYRNDAIEAFFSILDDASRAVFVRRNSLSRQHHRTARNNCRWPAHDAHLLAAAIDGDDPSIFVTEARLQTCAGRIYMEFSIRVEFLG